MSFWVQCKLQFIWVFSYENGELQLYKISGHIDNETLVFTPNPRPECRRITYNTLDGPSTQQGRLQRHACNLPSDQKRDVSMGKRAPT